ncbi:MAG: carboxylating nicotinate-nucleotide diphosphorylase [Planctomycetota bacterium]|nr:carboxylating nicotinate-nucleotide diphosphorylase [Planctomycetota bacterium]
MHKTAFHQHTWGPALEDDCRQLVRLAVREDLDRGHDWTTISLVPAESQSVAEVVVRAEGVVSGLSAAQTALCEMDTRIRWNALVEDGVAVKAGESIARLEGSTRDILTTERIVLNFLGHLSGIATRTRAFVKEVASTKAEIYDTRKTTPAWRRLEKYAVRCGGGKNHRTGLYDAILIKDNHLAFIDESRKAGFQSSLHNACEQAQEFIQRHPDCNSEEMILEVEVDNLSQLQMILPVKPDIVLLDNMSPEILREAVHLRDALAPEVMLEASGGVALASVAGIAETGIDRISVGGLTHAAPWLDIGLDWQG